MHKKTILDEYIELFSGIFHYQDQQIETKIICLKIILGTFAIIGLLSFANIDLSNSWFLIICALLPILSLIFITVNFFHDLVYKERLKLGFFSEAVKLEKENSWLPKFHNSLLEKTNTKNPTFNQSSFYLGCGAILISISALPSFFLINKPTIISKLAILILFVFIYILYVLYVFNNIQKTKKLFEINESSENVITETENDAEFLTLLHAKGKEFVEHFSNLKMRYKNLTITLVTAVFLAISYIIASQTIFFSSHENFISSQANFVHQNKIYIICFITLLTVISIRLIRNLDINVSHEQIRLLFKCLINMEQKLKKITKPYELISKTLYQKKFDPIVIDFLYYGSINLTVIILGFITALSQIRDYHSKMGMVVTLILTCSFLLWEATSFLITCKRKIKFKAK